MQHHSARAAVCRQFGEPLSIETISVASPGPAEVLVDIKACAVCHSDISYLKGDWGGTLPAVYGHEAAGIVLETGDSVSGIAPGDHVVVTLIRACGECHYCAGNSTVMCEGTIGATEALHDADGKALEKAMHCGAFADRALVHHSQMVVIDPDIPFDAASLLACGVITGFGAAVNTAAIKPGQSVAVIGCGGVGLNAIQGAVLAGATPVIALDLSPDKQRAALAFGATHALDPRDADTEAAIRELTAGRGVDAVLVTVGAKPAIEGALSYLGKNGAVVVVGMPPAGVMAQYDPSQIASFNQKIIGSKMGEAVIARDIPLLIEAWRAGRLKLEELITGRYKLEEINEAVQSVLDGDALRNVIVFD